MNPFDYLMENISWYAPIYNISWVLFMVFALTLPLIQLAIFKLPGLRSVQPTRTWRYHFQTYWYLVGAAVIIFCFRLIPYWIFNDKILHLLGGGMSIGLIYEYLVLNYDCYKDNRLISLKAASQSRAVHLLANLIMLLLFTSFFSVFSETYEFVSKYFAGVEFDSSGLDTWLDILNNVGGAYIAYGVLWLVKYGLRGDKNLMLGPEAAYSYGDD